MTAPERKPRTAKVPDLRGQTADAAVAALRALGLAVIPDTPGEVDGGVDLYAVVRTDPTAGKVVKRPGPVKVVVNSGTPNQILQAAIDGPRNTGNAVELPAGDWALDAPLVITKKGTRLVRRDKWDREVASISAPDGTPIFLFDYRGPVPDAEASVIWTDDPDHELTASGRRAIGG
jgi:hypothetical protein